MSKAKKKKSIIMAAKSIRQFQVPPLKKKKKLIPLDKSGEVLWLFTHDCFKLVIKAKALSLASPHAIFTVLSVGSLFW